MNKPRARIAELKTHPEEFQAVLDGRMPWQLRRNDRGYRVGDELLLKEWDPALGDLPIASDRNWEQEPRAYTGRRLLVRVDYIMDIRSGPFEGLCRHPNDPLRDDYIIMSISHVN